MLPSEAIVGRCQLDMANHMAAITETTIIYPIILGYRRWYGTVVEMRRGAIPHDLFDHFERHPAIWKQ